MLATARPSCYLIGRVSYIYFFVYCMYVFSIVSTCSLPFMVNKDYHKHISMLFLFPVKDGKLSTGVNATFNASCYG